MRNIVLRLAAVIFVVGCGAMGWVPIHGQNDPAVSNAQTQRSSEVVTRTQNGTRSAFENIEVTSASGAITVKAEFHMHAAVPYDEPTEQRVVILSLPGHKVVVDEKVGEHFHSTFAEHPYRKR